MHFNGFTARRYDHHVGSFRRCCTRVPGIFTKLLPGYGAKFYTRKTRMVMPVDWTLFQ